MLFPYAIEDQLLEMVSIKKDLGIIMDDKLSFSDHVDDLTRKAYRMLGFIFSLW